MSQGENFGQLPPAEGNGFRAGEDTGVEVGKPFSNTSFTVGVVGLETREAAQGERRRGPKGGREGCGDTWAEVGKSHNDTRIRPSPGRSVKRADLTEGPLIHAL